ncbi:MAG: GMC family oxidoreductase N-terminal domain-containing protein [Thermoanaerobaculia bacterium]
MFDFVVVGAGSAGCVLAGRLSEDPDVRVLLLEAGPHDRRLEVRVPAAFSRLFHGRRDWDLATEPEEPLAGRSLYVPRGRMLGGSSSLNAMIYIRGHRVDFDGWAATGCPGWSYAEVLPLFKRSEHQERGASEYHGAEGPLWVSDPRSPSPLSREFVAAAVASGLPANDDFNGEHQEGAGLYQLNQRHGRRWSSADAFLHPARSRPNLTVFTGTRATRVLWDGRRAVGVEYERRGRLEAVLVERSVVLAAGAIHSPHLLMLSGVGPAAELERAGVAVHHELPAVGRHLQDHPVVAVSFQTHGPTALESADSFASLARWSWGRRGPLTSNVAEGGGFFRSSSAEPAPDLQFHFAPALFEDHALCPGESESTSSGRPSWRRRARRGVAARGADARCLRPCVDRPGLERTPTVSSTGQRARAARRALAGLAEGPRAPVRLRSRAALRRWVRKAEPVYPPSGPAAWADECVSCQRCRSCDLENLQV